MKLGSITLAGEGAVQELHRRLADNPKARAAMLERSASLLRRLTGYPIGKAREIMGLEQKWDESQHPRAPAGSAEGGEFAAEGKGNNASRGDFVHSTKAIRAMQTEDTGRFAKEQPFLYYRLENDAKGVLVGQRSEIDNIVRQNSDDYQKLYAAFKNTRELIRKTYGDEVTLYRAPPTMFDKLVPGKETVNMGSKTLADLFATDGRRTHSYRVPVDDIIAAPRYSQGYWELVVRNPETKKAELPSVWVFRFYDEVGMTLQSIAAKWDEDQHPRAPAGSSQGGEFAVVPWDQVQSVTDAELHDILATTKQATTKVKGTALFPKSLDVLNDYTESAFHNINELVATGKVSMAGPIALAQVKAEADVIDKLFETVAPTKNELNVWRGAGTVADIPGLSVQDVQKRPQLLVGREFIERRFVSTSASSLTASNFAVAFGKGMEYADQLPVLFHYHVPPGAKVLVPPGVSGQLTEKEVLLPRNSQFKVVGVHEDKARHVWRIDAEFVGVAPEKTKAHKAEHPSRFVAADLEWLPPSQKWDESQHPRAPAGSSEGGQFASDSDLTPPDWLLGRDFRKAVDNLYKAQGVTDWEKGEYFDKLGLKAYFGNSGSFALNKALRSGGMLFDPLAHTEESLQDGFNRHAITLPANTHVYRIIGGNAGEQLPKLKAGETFVDKGYVSTSPLDAEKNPSLSHPEFTTVLHITTAGPMKALVYKDENELLFQKNRTFTVLSQSEHSGWVGIPRGLRKTIHIVNVSMA